MAQTVKEQSTTPAKPKMHSYPLRSPRFWHGMRFGEWLKLIARNGFRIHPLRMPMALAITLITPFHSMLYQLQNILYGKQIAQTKIDQAPIFIVGHWRSGTTFLHELMVLDDRLAYPTTYQCFAPHHFLLSQWFVETFLGFLLPKQRPMDNMATGWSLPQEDEFALLVMGAPTPYLRMAFPNHPRVYDEFLDMEEVAPEDLERWRTSLTKFVQLLTFHQHKRLVLKSPPHTGRIAELAKLYPNARFIHITRHPYSVFPSTRRLWQSLDYVQGLQLPKHKGLDEYVFAAFERMYRGFEKQRKEINPDRICDLRYEDLVEDPLGQIRMLYEKLELGDFEHVRPKLEEAIAARKSYKTNKHQLEEGVKEEIHRRWGDYMQRYGYEKS